MFKDAVRPTQNDEFYLLTDTEGNISIICFWNPIEETAQNSCKKKMKSLKVTNSYIAFHGISYGIPPICLTFSQRVIIISKLQIRIKF